MLCYIKNVRFVSLLYFNQLQTYEHRALPTLSTTPFSTQIAAPYLPQRSKAPRLLIHPPNQFAFPNASLDEAIEGTNSVKHEAILEEMLCSLLAYLE